MPNDVYPALGPGPGKDYKKLLVDALNRLITVAQPSGLRTAFLPTTLDVPDTAVALPLASQTARNSKEIYNLGATTIYIGNADVTADSVIGTTSGRPIPSNESWALDITEDITLYARSPGGDTNRVLIVEIS